MNKIFKGVRFELLETYNNISDEEKKGILWFVRNNADDEKGDIYFGKRHYGSSKNNIPLNIVTTNDSASVTLIADKIFIFNVAQTFSSKTFVIDLPDETNEHTWTLRFQLSSANPSVIFTAPSGYTLKWANNETPIFNGNGSAYEITFKYIPGVKLLLGVCGEF